MQQFDLYGTIFCPNRLWKWFLERTNSTDSWRWLFLVLTFGVIFCELQSTSSFLLTKKGYLVDVWCCLLLLWGTWASGPFQFYLKRETVVTMFIIINAILCLSFFSGIFFFFYPIRKRSKDAILFLFSLIWDRSRCK